MTMTAVSVPVLGSRSFVPVLICLAAFVIRVAYRLHGGDADFWQNGYVFFYKVATDIVAGNGLLSNVTGLGERPPVYPYFLALTALAGGNYLFIVIPEALFGAGTVFCAYLIGKELFSRRTGIIAALLTAFYPYYVVHDTALQETSLMTLTSTASVFLLLRARNSQSVGVWLIAGAAPGLGVLVRTTLLPFALASVAWIAAFGMGPTRLKMVRAVMVLLPLLAVVGAWAARNDMVLGRPVLSSEAGYQFWMAHNPQTFSRYPAESIDRSRDVALAALTAPDRQQLDSLGQNELAASDWFFHKGLDYIEANPRAALVGALRKLAAGFSWIFNPRRDALVQMVYLLSYGPISVLGILGMVIAGRDWRVHSLIYLQFLAFIAVTAIFWAHSDHRSYLDVYLIVFSAFAAEQILERLRQQRSVHSASAAAR